MPITVAVLDMPNKRWLAPIPIDDVYTVGETSRILGQSTMMVYSYIRRGKLAAYEVDGVRHVRHIDLVAFIKRYRKLQRSLNATIKPKRVVPDKKSIPENRKDFSIPLDYVIE